jgi:SOS-response transcriptional repressors (RecA-mediated autopeptidases)
VKAMENVIKHIKGTGRERVYNFIVEFIKNNGYAPSVREICVGTDLSSTSSVYAHLLKLEDEGKIEMKRKSTRAIKVIGFQFVKMEGSA